MIILVVTVTWWGGRSNVYPPKLSDKMAPPASSASRVRAWGTETFCSRAFWKVLFQILCHLHLHHYIIIIILIFSCFSSFSVQSRTSNPLTRPSHQIFWPVHKRCSTKKLRILWPGATNSTLSTPKLVKKVNCSCNSSTKCSLKRLLVRCHVSKKVDAKQSAGFFQLPELSR